MADLGELLREHKTAQGRYPTNDEGLAALGSFEARFKVRYLGQVPGQGFSGFPEAFKRYWWRQAKQTFLGYRALHGHVPRNAEELNETGLIRGAFLPEGADVPAEGVAEAELGITKSGNLLLLGPGGVLTPWLVPYLYENRAGLPASVFEGSPCDRDSRRRFSVSVDDSVFVYAAGGQLCAAEYDASWWEHYGPRMAGAAMLAAAAVCVAFLWGAWRRRAIYGMIAVVASAIGGSMAASLFPTRYVMTPFFAHRDPAMVVRQRELLEKYRQHGAISAETFRKSVSCLDSLVTPAKAGTD